MAVKYCYSGAAGAGTGADWANAVVRLDLAPAVMSAGDDCVIADDHSESSASSRTTNFPGTAQNPNRVYCARRSGGSTPPVDADIRDTAVITTTGASSYTIGGQAYIRGITFNIGTGNVTASFTKNGGGTLQNCAFNILATGTACRINVAGGSNLFNEYIDCTFRFSNASQSIGQGTSPVLIRGGSVAATGTLPTTLLSGAGDCILTTFDGVDLSALSSKNFAGTGFNAARFVNCKMPASYNALAGTLVGNIFAGNWRGIQFEGCNSSGVYGRTELYRPTGQLTTETTIKRTAGASDGATAFSWKLVNTSLAAAAWPFVTPERIIWNDVVGSQRTLTVHVITDNDQLTADQLILEIEYLGSSGSPITSRVTTAPGSILATGSNLASDSSEAWTTTGLTTPLKLKLSANFTPQMAGPIRWRLRYAKASGTVYVCPRGDLT